MNGKGIALRLMASVAAIVPATAGFAQSDAPAADAAALDNADIVVTAQRRAETLEKVPVSVTAVPPARLEQLNLRGINTLATISPGVVFDTGLGFSQSYLRGIGSNYPQAGLESPIATYIDGAYLQRNQGAVFDLLDAGTVQLLKGPQGTLYGRNATGGVILLNSADPVQAFEGHVLGEYGRFDHALIEGVVNAPLTDTLAVRFAGRFSRDDGYVDNLTTGKAAGGGRSYVVRGKAKWEPSADFAATLTVENSRQRFYDPFFSFERLSAPACLACALGGNTGNSPTEIRNDVSVHTVNKSSSVNLRMKGTAGDFTIESVTSYRNLKTTGSILDLDGTDLPLFAFDNTPSGKTFTQDLTVATSSDSWIDGIVGASYLYDDARAFSRPNGLAFAAVEALTGEQPESRQRVQTTSVSVFGELTLRPIEHLSITAGGRYNYDERSLDVAANQAAVLAFGGGVTPPLFRQSVAFRSFTPRFVIAYNANPINLYASFNRGFRAGGYNTPTFAPQIAIKPEEIDSYEIGIKYLSDDRRLRASIAAFYYRYRDVQVSIVNVENGGTTIQNAASARGRGIEAEVSYAVAPKINLFAGGSYLHARYRSFKDASVAAIDPDTGGLVQSLEDLSGFSLPRAPEWTGFIGFDAQVPLGSWVGGLNAILRYTDGYDFFPGAGGPLRLDSQPSVTMINASAYIGPDDGRYQIGVYVNNLANARYYNDRSTSAPFSANENVALPRTYGVRVKYSF